MKKRFWMVLAFVLLLLFSLAGCGNNTSEKEDKKQEDKEQEASYGINGYVYVPEYFTLSSDGYPGEIIGGGDSLYYSVWNYDEETYDSWVDYYRMNLESDETEKLLIDFSVHGESISVMSYIPDKEGNLFFFLNDYTAERVTAEGYPQPDTYLAKYDSAGTELFWQDITNVFSEMDYFYVQNIAIDGEGHLYAGYEETVFLFDENGAFQGKIEINDYVDSMGTGKDGKAYLTKYGRDSYEICEIDYQAKKLGATYSNVPSGYGDSLVVGLDKDFLIYDQNGVYEYDCSTQSYEQILNWLDSDVYGDYVRTVLPMEDGRLLVLASGFSGIECMYLTKTETSMVQDRKLITIGSLYMNSELQGYAVEFNKKNTEYRIVLKYYYDYQSGSETAYEDAITAMNNEIISGNGPDVINLNAYMNIQNYVQKEVLEDLNPYLEASAKVHKEDYLDAVINAYTYDGVLTCIPTSFAISTVVGRSSQVGEDMGWTLDEMIALMDENPEAMPFYYASKEEMLRSCLAFNQDAFVDWENLSCNFDSEDFKKVLEFVNRFPSEVLVYDGRSEGNKIAAGEILLHEAEFYDLNTITEAPQLFGTDEITYVGYPTLDGSVGCVLRGFENSYGISAKSGNKEGAWEFIESVLATAAERSSDGYSWGLPSNKASLENKLSEATANPYETDEKGNILLDENGEPIRFNFGWTTDDDGFEVYMYAPLPEEIDVLRELINVAGRADSSDEQIMKIILEEAEPYFQGQKSVEEVTKIIQSKVKIYVSENQ